MDPSLVRTIPRRPLVSVSFPMAIRFIALLWIALPLAAQQTPAAGTPAVTPRPVEETLVVEEDLVVAEDLVVEEELADSAAGITNSSSSGLDEEAVQVLFDEAEKVLLEGDQPTALLRFGQLMDLFETWLFDAETARQEDLAAAAEEDVASEVTTPSEDDSEEADLAKETPGPPPPSLERLHLSPKMHALFIRTLAYRAELYHAFGDGDQATATFERMLKIDPGANLETERVAADFLKSFERLRKKRVGQLLLVPEPPDMVVHLDGRRVESFAEPVSVLAGELWLTAERPGYGEVAQSLDVRAGREETIELVLERTSPVLRLHTRPPGASVFLNNRQVGVTGGTAPADFLPQTATVRYRSEEFSEEFVIDELEPGLQILEVTHPGYRPYREELAVEELLDYPMPPIVLEEERGFIAFRNFPTDAQLNIDDRPHRLDEPRGTRPRVTLPPGVYRVTVTSGRARMFSTDLRIADRQTVEVNVRLRPGLTFLGALGGEAAVTRDLVDAVNQALGRSEAWALLDRTAEGQPILADAGLGAASEAVDWHALQARVDREVPGLLYLAAVLDGGETRFLLWPAAPGPARADELRLPRGDARALDRLLAALEPDIPYSRPWLGAVLLDSSMAPHPVVAAVTSGSSAEAIGLQPGEQLVAVAGAPVFSRTDVLQQLQSVGEGTVDLGVQGPAGPRRLQLQLRPGPAVLRPERDNILPAVAWATLGLKEEKSEASRRWLVQLNSALLLMDAGDWAAAAAALRRVDAPQSSHGFGQAAVDYWLGLALERSGDFAAAREAYTRAMRLPEARLYHADGPLLAPRARARLAGLGGSSGSSGGGP